MINKKDIELSLKFLAKQKLISNFQVENDISICTPEEYAEVAMCSVEEAFEELGKFDFVVIYSDYPDYLLFSDIDISNVQLDRFVIDWLKEIKIIR